MKLTPSRISLEVVGDRIALKVPKNETPMFTTEQARAFAAALVNLAEQLEAAPAIPTKTHSERDR